MKKIVVITSKFNIMTGARNSTYSSNELERFEIDWIFNRVSIFMKFTAQSLINQTNQDFIALYAYEDSTEKVIQEAFSKYDKLPDNIRFVRFSEYMNVLDEITKGYDVLFLTRLDSDDLYCNDFVDRIMNYELNDEIEEILCQRGYIYDSVNNRLAEYYHRQFTFYTFIYRLSKEKENEKYSSLSIDPMELLLDFSHFRTIDYKYEVLEGRNFMFIIHKKNTNSSFSDYNYGFNRVERFIDNQQEISDILYDFL